MATAHQTQLNLKTLGLALLTFHFGATAAAQDKAAPRPPTGDAYFNKVPSPEVMVLPRYCWAQYLPNIPATPEFTISVELCGWATNHLCGGFIEMNRAKKKWGDKLERGGLLHAARGDFKYTLNGIQKYPNCPIRADAEKGLAEVEQLMKLSGQR